MSVMSDIFLNNQQVSEYLTDNREDFKQRLLSEAVNVGSKINDILEKGNIDLLKNAEILAHYIIEDNNEDLV
jgi:rsbT co-antagonist protein RsbR